MACIRLSTVTHSSLISLPPLRNDHHRRTFPFISSRRSFAASHRHLLLTSCSAYQWRRGPRTDGRSTGVEVFAQKVDIYKVVGKIVKAAVDFVDAGTRMVPESVPRSLAQAGVAAVGILIVSFVLKSIFSIALFVLAIGGVSYFVFNYLSKDEDSGGNGGSGDGSNTDLALEEARRIMEKYK